MAGLASQLPSVGSIISILGLVGFGGMLKSVLDYRRNRRKDSEESALDLVEKLTARLGEVEVRAENQAREAQAKIDAINLAAADERDVCEAKLSVLRHKFVNLDMSFDGLLLLFKMAPDKAAEFIPEIERKRTEQREREANETAQITAAIVLKKGAE